MARRAHTQHAGYLDPINDAGEWNPSDYAVHLSRRARGLPFWFSLAMHGTDSYRDAIESTLQVARRGADEIRSRPYLELLVEPDLTVLHLQADRAGRPRTTPPGRSGCSTRGTRSSPPPTHQGEPCTRFAIINPRTTVSDLTGILATMSLGQPPSTLHA